jgi:hypothetical protein
LTENIRLAQYKILILDVGPMYTVHGAHTYYNTWCRTHVLSPWCTHILQSHYSCYYGSEVLPRYFFFVDFFIVAILFLFCLFKVSFSCISTVLLFNLYSCFGLLLALMLLSQHANKRQLNWIELNWIEYIR